MEDEQKMTQEEEIQKCSNSNSNGGSGSYGGGVSLRSSKKQKQKKVPQRGLGVAQLEKIRLEEQQKKDGSSILKPISSPTRHNSGIPLPIPDYQTFSSALAYTPDLSSSPNSHSTFPLVTSMGWPSGGPKMWTSCDYNLGLKESGGVDDGLTFRSGMSLPYESKPIWPPPALMHKAQQYQHPLSPLPLTVNGSSGSSSSSLLNYQIEPPSNQSCYSNDIAPPWPEEEKMVGMKRPYPFSLDNPLGQSFQCNGKFPPVMQPVSRSDELASFSNGGAFSNHPVANLREVPCFNANLDTKNLKDNGATNEDFLAFAPPTNLSCQSTKFRRSSGYLPFDFESLPYQGTKEDSNMHQASNHQQAYYSFLPATIMQTGQATKTINNCNGCHEVGENVDLDLKL